MKKLLKTTIIFTGIMLLLLLLAELIMAHILTQYAFNAHWVVALYFWIFYMGALFFMGTKISKAVFMKYIMGLKAAKLFASLFFIAIAAFIMRDNIVALVFTFFIYYLLLLIPECAYSIYMKKHIK